MLILGKRFANTPMSGRRPALPAACSANSRPPDKGRTRRSCTDAGKTSLVGTGSVDHAAIFSVDGTSVWATSSSFTVKPEEMKEIVASYNDKSDVKKVQSEGVHVGGHRYVVIKADDRSLYGKKVRRRRAKHGDPLAKISISNHGYLGWGGVDMS